MKDFVITAASVTAGHPDKLCDQISDAVVDAHLSAGTRSAVIAECAIATGVVFLSVRTEETGLIDPAALARRIVADAGYGEGRDGDRTTVVLDLGDAPVSDGALAAGRARHMTTAFGYACRHTPTLMPFPIAAAHDLARALDRSRTDGRLPWLSPDAQVQVAVRFEARRPVALEAIAVTFGAEAPPPEADLRQSLLSGVILPTLAGAEPAYTQATRLVLVPLPGRLGPAVHSGLTGRKTADDAYGDFARRGGAALSGKDPSRIDRIAAYAARHAARAVVEAGLAGEIEVQLSYLIGDEGPASIDVDTFGTGTTADETISGRLAEALDFRVAAIAERLGLWELPGRHGGVFYRRLAAYGHMGREDVAAPWEDVSEAARALA